MKGLIDRERESALDEAAGVFGLIAESQFGITELYGFEVDVDGKVVAPEFPPAARSSPDL